MASHVSRELRRWWRQSRTAARQLAAAVDAARGPTCSSGALQFLPQAGSCAEVPRCRSEGPAGRARSSICCRCRTIMSCSHCRRRSPNRLPQQGRHRRPVQGLGRDADDDASPTANTSAPVGVSPSVLPDLRPASRSSARPNDARPAALGRRRKPATCRPATSCRCVCTRRLFRRLVLETLDAAYSRRRSEVARGTMPVLPAAGARRILGAAAPSRMAGLCQAPVSGPQAVLDNLSR